MNGLNVWAGHWRRKERGWPLTMSWKVQLIAEAEAAVRHAGNGAELGRAVWALAKIVYAQLEETTPEALLFVRGEPVAHKLTAAFVLPDDAAKLLLELAAGEAEENVKGAADAQAIRTLQKLAVRLIQYTRSLRVGMTIAR
ncbi:hypothetical protein PAESOLCIP111_06241 [Paenibacillus solanacearum]|uniref:Uncharacterized protein n=1 Tax=Paenibacillus solanacearum TaxID=2048548 RepID=A0A916KAC5_9BACL|nr:hypothetical protein [Paenibacillus solanacearum]CAG7651077.1 hypothetical protein PAESOLCIP111_06241 [Paenibacillus solanacearum]